MRWRRLAVALAVTAAAVAVVALCTWIVASAEDPVEACMELGGQAVYEPSSGGRLRLEECIMPPPPQAPR